MQLIEVYLFCSSQSRALLFLALLSTFGAFVCSCDSLCPVRSRLLNLWSFGGAFCLLVFYLGFGFFFFSLLFLAVAKERSTQLLPYLAWKNSVVRDLQVSIDFNPAVYQKASLFHPLIESWRNQVCSNKNLRGKVWDSESNFKSPRYDVEVMCEKPVLVCLQSQITCSIACSAVVI